MGRNKRSDCRLPTYPYYMATLRDRALPISYTPHPRVIMEPLAPGVQHNTGSTLRAEVAAIEKAYMDGASSDIDFDNESVGFISNDGEVEEAEDEILNVEDFALEDPFPEQEGDYTLNDREWWRQRVRRF